MQHYAAVGRNSIAMLAIHIIALADLLYPTVRYDDNVAVAARPRAQVRALAAKCD
jgi:hypothetical protein